MGHYLSEMDDSDWAFRDLERDNAALRARVEKLERELKYYGAHKKCCGWEVNKFGSPVLTEKCNCGLDAALAECEEVGK